MDQQMTSISDRIRAAIANSDDGNSEPVTTAGEGAPARVFDANDYAAKPWVAAIFRAVEDSRQTTEAKAAKGQPEAPADFDFDTAFEDEPDEFFGPVSSSLSTDSEAFA
jgi:hypothetical protein